MATGQRTTATDTSIQREIIAETIHMVEWTEAPLIKHLGLEGESKFRWQEFGSGKLQIIEDAMSPLADALAAAVADTSTESITVDNGDYFHAGHVLEIDTEYVHTRSVSGNVLTVTRGYAGTTKATHLENAVVSIVGIAMNEGANYVLGHTTAMSLPYNYTQEIQEAVQDTWKNKSTNRYAVDDELEYHLAKLIGGRTEIGGRGTAGQLLILLGKMPYKGKRQQGIGTSTPAMAGGLDTFITTNLGGSSSTEFTQKLIEDQMANIYDAGGNPDLLVTGTWGMRKINAMFKDTIRTDRSEAEGGHVISSVKTTFGTVLDVMFDKWIPAGQAYILDTNKVGWITVNPFDVYDKPSMGAYDVKMVWGEYSFMVANDQAHAKITFSTSK